MSQQIRTAIAAPPGLSLPASRRRFSVATATAVPKQRKIAVQKYALCAAIYIPELVVQPFSDVLARIHYELNGIGICRVHHITLDRHYDYSPLDGTRVCVHLSATVYFKLIDVRTPAGMALKNAMDAKVDVYLTPGRREFAAEYWTLRKTVLRIRVETLEYYYGAAE